MTFNVTTPYAEYKDCRLTRAAYSNGHIALSIDNDVDGPIAHLTVNIDCINDKPENWVAVDTNNFPEAEALIEQLGIGVPVGLGVSGFCLYPVYKFDTEAVEKYL